MIISKQFENSENLERCLEIVNKKQINLIIVEGGESIKLEKDLYFEILWPISTSSILENALNNNSLVCKLVYNRFSILFTGDIEEIAETAILEKYNNFNLLKSDILKVAHHGSKTSSIMKFLKAVKPKIALIGVGKDNTFGHPSQITIDNLKLINTEIYRTDENGEIIIKIDKKGISTRTFVKK